MLSRQPDAWRRIGSDVDVVVGDPTVAGPWQDQLASCDAAVNLAGAGIFDKRWNAAYKALIRDSRLRSTENVMAALTRAAATPKVLVNGSAIGYYGPHGDEELDESSPAGSDYLAQVCVAWESSATAAQGVRVVLIRTGVVLDGRGGR